MGNCNDNLVKLHLDDIQGQILSEVWSNNLICRVFFLIITIMSIDVHGPHVDISFCTTNDRKLKERHKFLMQKRKKKTKLALFALLKH